MDPQASLERVLVVTAHPDDVDFGAAGTVATLTAAGSEVTYCIVTDGQAGGSDHAITRAQMATIRRREQQAAAAAVGVTDVRFLGYADGELAVSHELRRDITRVIRQVRPTVVITQSPERRWDRIPASHPDHLATGEATVQALYPDCGNPFAHPSLLADEGLEPWSVPWLWLMVAHEPNHVIDVTDAVERKFEALFHHASQISDPDVVRERVTGWLTMQAEAAGLPAGRLAEVFRSVQLAF